MSTHPIHLLQTVRVTDTYLDLADIATRLGITRNSARVHHTRATRNRRAGDYRPGDLPAPDIVLAGHPGWRPQTIDVWERNRPGTAPDPEARRAWLKQHRRHLREREGQIREAINVINDELRRLDGAAG